MFDLETQILAKADLIEALVLKKDFEEVVDKYFATCEITTDLDKVDIMFEVLLNLVSPSTHFLSEDDKNYYREVFTYCLNDDTLFILDFILNFYIIYVEVINKDLVEVSTKLELLEAVPYTEVSPRLKAKKLFLTLYLNLLISRLPLDFEKITTVKEELNHSILAQNLEK